MKYFYVLFFLLIFISTSAYARDPKWSGLAAVAVSPDGQKIVVGGQNRVLFEIDTNSMKVTKRLWFKARIGNLAFSKDGSILLVEDDDEDLHYYNSNDLTFLKKVKKCSYISPCPAVDILAAETGSYRQKEIILLSMKDATIIKNINLPVKLKVAGFSLSSDGKKLVVLSDKIKGGEPKVSYNKIPKDLKGLAKEEFKQKNDGYVSKLFIYDVESGNQLSNFDLWYTSSSGSTSIVINNEETIVFNYNDINAKIDKDGNTSLFKTGSLGYGRGVSFDHKTFLTGGLRRAVYVKTQGLEKINFKIDSIPGWPEYFECFTFTSDGTAYGVTSAFRLIKIKNDGTVEKTIPIY